MADTKTVVSDGVLSEKTLTFAGSGTLLIMKKSVKRILMAVGVLLLALPAVSAPEAAKRFKLVIDAGHGGHDAGRFFERKEHQSQHSFGFRQVGRSQLSRRDGHLHP